MFEIGKTLIVVYKNELILNQLKKMVHSGDKSDNSINIISWEEKTWLAQKNAGNITDRVLFLGDIKGTDKLIPVLDIKFDDYGVKYGWSGNQAVLFTDAKKIKSKDKYLSFIEKLSDLPIPEENKRAKNVRLEQNQTQSEEELSQSKDAEVKKEFVFVKQTKEGIHKGAHVFSQQMILAEDRLRDWFRNKNLVTEQMMLYGVVQFYNHGLEEFMNM